MPIVAWDDTYKINNYEIDGQHKKLIDIVNSLHEAMKEGKSNEVLGSELNALMAYTKIHFKTEERMLEENKFPYIENHKIEHNKFINKIETLRLKFENGQVGLSMELMDYLSHWIAHHIKKVDVEYTKNFISQPA